MMHLSPRHAVLGLLAATVFILTGPHLIHASGEYVQIQAVSPTGAINPGTSVSFVASASGFVDPVYSVSLGTIDKIGNFSWTPSITDAGRNTVTVSVSDYLNHLATTSTTILVAANNITLSNPSPASTVIIGQTVTFSATAPGFISPTYNLYDSGYSQTLSSANINSSGAVSWTPGINDAGTHTLTVQASDSLGHSARASVTITVTSTLQTSPPATPATPPATTPVVTAPTPAPVTTPVVAPSLSTPTPTASYTFMTLLALGSRGQAVTELQKKLISLGYLKGVPTGYFGTLTATAVKDFQTAHKLPRVGFTGPGTRAVLNSL